MTLALPLLLAALAAEPSPALAAYAGGLRPGWRTGDWPCAGGAHPVIDAASARAPGGRKPVIEVTQECPGFGAFELQRVRDGWKPHPLRRTSAVWLAFDFNPGESPEAAAALELDVQNESPRVALSKYLAAPLAAGQWQRIRVPLSELSARSAPFYRLVFFNARDGATRLHYFLDQIALEGPAAAPPGPAGPVVLTVDAAAPGKAISPFIYGLNSPRRHARFVRFGGNRWTGYNWRTNASNSGTDTCTGQRSAAGPGCSVNDAWLGGGARPAGAVLDGLLKAHALGAAALLTVPILDVVAADAAGAHRLIRSEAHGQAPGAVSQDEFVRYVAKHAPQGQEVFYSLDNEPGLWPVTHPLLHPGPTTYAEAAERTLRYAAMIKDQAPSARVFGGVFYGWSELVDLQGAPDAQGRPYLPFLLAAWRTAGEQQHRRLVDVLDLHWYPEVRGPEGRIAESDGGAHDEEEIAARVDAPRSLWDPHYREQSWIADGLPPGEGIRLIPRVREAIAAAAPGTLLAISEYDFGGSADASGAVAVADALGIFGREGLFAAAMWDFRHPDDSFALAGLDAYLDYDGRGSAVGSLSLPASSSDARFMSVYAMAGPGKIWLVLVNKSRAEVQAEVRLGGLSSASGPLFRVTGAQPRLVPAGAAAAAAGRLALALPGLSVTVAELHR